MSESIRILIAEDDEQARRALTELLEDEGYQARAANNGDDAARLLESEPFDVALLDVRMPGRDGLSLLRELRKREDAPSTLVMTAYGASSIAIEAMKLGAYDYLAKPLRFDELLIQIRPRAGGAPAKQAARIVSPGGSRGDAAGGLEPGDAEGLQAHRASRSDGLHGPDTR